MGTPARRATETPQWRRLTNGIDVSFRLVLRFAYYFTLKSLWNSMNPLRVYRVLSILCSIMNMNFYCSNGSTRDEASAIDRVLLIDPIPSAGTGSG